VLAARSHALIVPNVGRDPFVKDARIRFSGDFAKGARLSLPEYRVAETFPIRVRLVVRPRSHRRRRSQAVIARIKRGVGSCCAIR